MMASITCGNCKRTHTAVDEVRACYYWDSDEARADAEAEAYAERKMNEWALGFRDDDPYVGSEEEARDRWLDSLNEVYA